MKIIRKVPREEYLNLVRDYTRHLFDTDHFRLLDGLTDLEQRYFFIKELNTKEYYEIDERTSYELLVIHYTMNPLHFSADKTIQRLMKEFITMKEEEVIRNDKDKVEKK